MPAATPLTKRVRALLAYRGLTVGDMAAAIGRDELTIRNVLTENAVLIPTRQAITDFVGVELFAGIEPRMKQVAFKLQSGTMIALTEQEAARSLHFLLRNNTTRNGNRIELRDDVIVRIQSTPEPVQLEEKPPITS
jgi:hypothetical protein